MEITKSERTTEKLRFSIIFDKNEWIKLQSKALDRISKKLNIVGFRKGHVPLDIAKKHISEKEIINEAINESTKVANNIINKEVYPKEKDIFRNTLSFDIGEIDKTFELICEFNIYPDVSMPNYKKLNIKFQKTELSPLDVVHFIKEITKKDGMLVPKDSDTIENGDTVVFDFKGFINGSPFEGGESQFFELQIGSHQFIPGFEEQMIGLKKGEQKTIDVNFPNDYHAKDFAGKKAQFEINIRDIKLFQQQKLDDEYIKTLNIPKVNNKEDLENFVKCKLSYENHMTDNRNNIHLLYEFLIANVKLSYIPEFFIEKEINNINSNLSQQAEREEKTFDEFMMQKFNLKSNEEIKNEIRKQAQNNIILSLALDKMLKDLNIITSPTDRENFYEKISQVYNTDINEIKKTINKSDDDVDNIILEDKIIETIISIQE